MTGSGGFEASTRGLTRSNQAETSDVGDDLKLGMSNVTQKTIFPIKYAMTTDDTVATIPGTIKLWFKTYFPIPVVPV
jgi:hypothetical protein